MNASKLTLLNGNDIFLFVEHIVAVYHWYTPPCTVVQTVQDIYEVKESPEQIMDLMPNLRVNGEPQWATE